MFHIECQGFVYVTSPFVDSLSRKTEHQVNADVANTYGAEPFDGCLHIRSLMATMKKVQTLVGKSLHPHADAVDRELGQGLDHLFIQIVRIAFNGCLNDVSGVIHLIYI